MRKLAIILIIFVFMSININAQKKLSLDINIGVLHSIGKDVIKTYNSNIQPLQIGYFSWKKFEHTYVNVLANLNYSIDSKITLGLQSGIYIHFNERYFGYTKPNSVSIPVMASCRISVFKLKTNTLGLNLSGGNIFFDIDANYDKLKNGTLLNISAFYLANKKHILKLGVEKQSDKGISYFSTPNNTYKDEALTYQLNRLSIVLSYGFIITK